MKDIPFVAPLAQSGGFRGGGERPLYGVPLNRSTPLMYCNGEIFAKEGLRPPTTWRELVDTAKALTRPGERWGHEVPISWWFWVALVGQAGGAVFDESGPRHARRRGGRARAQALAGPRASRQGRCVRRPVATTTRGTS